MASIAQAVNTLPKRAIRLTSQIRIRRFNRNWAKVCHSEIRLAAKETIGAYKLPSTVEECDEAGAKNGRPTR